MSISLREDLALLRRLILLARPYWSHTVGLFVLTLLSAPLALLSPLPLKIAVDSVIGSEALPGPLQAVLPQFVTGSTQGLLLFAGALLLAIVVLTQGVSTGSSVLKTYVTEKLVLQFRSRLLSHAQRLSLSHHDSQGVADSVYRIYYDASSVQYVILDGLIPFVTAICTFAGMIYVTAVIDLQLALLALSISPVLMLIARSRRKRLRPISRDVKKLESAAWSVIQEVLGALRVVKAFGQEEREEERFRNRAERSVQTRIRYSLVEGGFGLIVGGTTAIGTAAVLFVGVTHVQAGILTLGDLLLVMTYLTRVYEPLQTMGRKTASLQNHLASAERAFALLDLAPDVTEKPGAVPITRAAGKIEFQDVCFGYEANRPVLRDISFTVEPGTRVGISGRTGAGKSTLLSLLARFYDPTSGTVRLDDVDLTDYRVTDLRDQFGFVLQEPVLFSTTIAENIAYAKPDASDEDITRAARLANAHEFIVDFPDGYQTLVGERGMQLSGGERQRIALARAFLKDAPILILDEPTSSVDLATEKLIMEALQRLMSDRTTFMIAHRLSTLKGCDLRLSLKEGRMRSAESTISSSGDHALLSMDTASQRTHVGK